MEVWKDAIGYESYYQVSNLGNVRSLDRLDCAGRKRKGRLQALSPQRGYNYVRFCMSSKAETRSVHRLVARAFLPNPDSKPEVNHIDGVKTNNRVENLEWCNSSENSLHAVYTGLRVAAKGENNGNACISELQAQYILWYRVAGAMPVEIAQMFQIPLGVVQRVANGTRWKHLQRN